MAANDTAPNGLKILQQVELFHGLAPPDLQFIEQLAQTKQIQRGEFFFHQDSSPVALHVLTEGQVKMTQTGPEGHQVLVRMLSPGKDFGAMSALVGVPYSLSAQAVENSQALVWDQSTTQLFLQKCPGITLNALRLVGRRFAQLQKRYRELATERVEQRVARALLRLARQAGHRLNGYLVINLSLTRQDLAEMTGTTLYSVSRILSEWERQGLIETSRSEVIVRQLPQLTAIAEEWPAGFSS